MPAGRVSVLLACVVLLAAPPVALAAVAGPTSVEELARGADAVVQGRVERRTSRWSADGRHIHTLVTLRSARVLRGSAPEEVVVRVPGGVVGDVGQRVDAAPAFDDGEEVVVFLARDRAGDWRVHGLALGKFRVEAGQARPSLEAVRFSPGEVAPGERRVEAMPLDELESRVRSAR